MYTPHTHIYIYIFKIFKIFKLLRYLRFCPDIFDHIGIWLHKKANVSFRIHNVTTWETKNYNRPSQ